MTAVRVEVENDYIAWKPNPGKQTEFLASPAFEVLYGGARGGGKTAAMLAEACRQADWQGVLPIVLEKNPDIGLKEAEWLARKAARQYTAIIFRRTLPELEDLIGKALDWIPKWFPGAKWNEQKKTMRFPSGATIKFRYLKRKNDWRNYQGHEYTFMGFEELTNFEEEAYINVLGSCRTGNPYLTPEVRATCNPGGVGHTWVRARFVDAAPWGHIFWDRETKLTRQFIPAGVRDNPVLMESDPGYVKRLMLLPERDRRAMLDGDWDAFEGSVFTVTRGIHIIDWKRLSIETASPPGIIPDSWPIFMSMDWGYGAPFSIGWWCVDPYGRLYRIKEWYGCERKQDGSAVPNKGLHMADPKIAEGILAREEAWGLKDRVQVRFADPSMFNPRALAADVVGPPLSEIYAENGIYLTRADNNRIAGKQQLHMRLDLFQLDADRESPAIFILDNCVDWIRTVPSLPADEKNPDDIDTKAEDHTYDETRYMLMGRAWTPIEIVEQKRWLGRQYERRGWKG